MKVKWDNSSQYMESHKKYSTPPTKNDVMFQTFYLQLAWREFFHLDSAKKNSH
jgi:hypothetical protein